jgi:3-methyladenine DNA glycosylase AlkC
MDDEGLPWSSLKRKSDKYAKNGEEIMDILVDDIDRYQQCYRYACDINRINGIKRVHHRKYCSISGQSTG